MKKSYGQLTLDQALVGAHTCLGNAAELLGDAVIFLKAKKYSRSFALCEIANEELGKISILMQIYLTSSKKLSLLEILVKKDKRFKELKKKNELEILWDAFYRHEVKASFALMKLAQEKLTGTGRKVFGHDLKDLSEGKKMLTSILLVYANPSILDHINESEVEKKNNCFYVNYHPSTQKWTEPKDEIDEVEALTQMTITKDLMKSYIKTLEELTDKVMKFYSLKDNSTKG